ncbi:MAG TPA: hypothetical protein VH592_00445 [Gemmataceae bacterium]|jgi:DNA-directed RNA polymerase specialized sigma24 family protein
MIEMLQKAPYESRTADGRLQASRLASEGTVSTVCGHATCAPISVLLTLEDWILGIGIRGLQNFIVKTLPLTGATREDREDLAQEVLSRLHISYGHDRKSPANWWGLLKPTIRSAAFDFLRQQRRRVKVSAGIEVEPIDRGSCATAHWTRNEMVEELLDLKSEGCAITDEGIEMLLLKLYDKAKLAAIAKILGYKGPSGVHPKLHAAIGSVIAFRMATSNVSPSLANSASTP